VISNAVLTVDNPVTEFIFEVKDGRVIKDGIDITDDPIACHKVFLTYVAAISPAEQRRELQRFVQAAVCHPRTAPWSMFSETIKALAFNPGDYQEWEFAEKVEIVCLHFSAKESVYAEFIAYTDNERKREIKLDIPRSFEHVLVKFYLPCNKIRLQRLDYSGSKTPVFVVYVDGKVRED